MTVLITSDPAILAEIASTPAIEGGMGPVAIGIPVESSDGRYAISHPFAGVDRAWLEAYVAEEYPGTQVLDSLPKDWTPKDWQEAPEETE